LVAIPCPGTPWPLGAYWPPMLTRLSLWLKISVKPASGRYYLADYIDPTRLPSSTCSAD
jgi:hypothetical protein